MDAPKRESSTETQHPYAGSVLKFPFRQLNAFLHFNVILFLLPPAPLLLQVVNIVPLAAYYSIAITSQIFQVIKNICWLDTWIIFSCNYFILETLEKYPVGHARRSV